MLYGMAKKRVTVTVDEHVLQVAAQAVRDGDADSVSSWISEAMVDRRAKELRLAALGDMIADYEAEHGVITAGEIERQQQVDRDAAALVRLSQSTSS